MNRQPYFLKPRVGAAYAEGFRGLRTLVVGACHICSLECPHHALCGNPESVWEMDRKCPCYLGRADEDYHCLSNSNEIEIRSFIEGDAQYPAYKIFTYYMLRASGDLPSERREELWDSLAFTNLLQFFHDSAEVLPGDPAVYDAGVGALAAVVRELEPRLILAWDERVKDALRRRPEAFAYIGKADMQFGLALYLFRPKESPLKPLEMQRLRSRFGFVSDRHRYQWHEKLLRTHLAPCLTGSAEANDRVLRHLANTLMDMEGDGIIEMTESALKFSDNGELRWSSLLKGLFLRAVKDQYPELGRGTNGAMEAIFGERLATNKRSEELLTPKDAALAKSLRRFFTKSVGPGKTFSKNA